MSAEATMEPTTAPTPPTPATDTGLDRAFLMSMARVPFIAVGWFAAGLAAAGLWPQLFATQGNYGLLAVLCFGMLLAASIDGYAFKVPNWLTLSLVMSGWYLGIARDLGFATGGSGGVGPALLGTLIGFAALFPALFIGGMGQGDVKMTMGFGSWCGAFFGWEYQIPAGTTVTFIYMIWWSFALGVVIGGVFGIVIIALRRQFSSNATNFSAIGEDLKVMMTEGAGAANARAMSRRKDWVRLPYGVPLCVGFLGFLVWELTRTG